MPVYSLDTKLKAIEMAKELGSINQSANILNINRNTISRWCDDYENNRPIRSYYNYTCNHRFFQEINTEEAAYILGFIISDGSIGSGKYDCSMRIGIHTDDIELLYKIKKAMNSNHKLKFGKKQKLVTLDISSKRMHEDLINLGVTPNKSLTAKPIKIRNDLKKHFWRGVVDGDGSIFFLEVENQKHYRPSCRFAISLAGTKDICFAFSEFLGYKGKFIYQDGNIYKFLYRKKEGVYLACKKLYERSSIYLDRKYELYKQIEKLMDKQMALF